MRTPIDSVSIPDGVVYRWEVIAKGLGEAGSTARTQIAALHDYASPRSLQRTANAVHLAVTRLTGDDAKIAAALLAEIDEVRADAMRNQAVANDS